MNGSYRIEPALASDEAEIENLLDRAFGKTRCRKTSERLREGRKPAPGLALVAKDDAGEMIATLRLWPVFAGGRRPMMLIQNTGMLESGDSIRGWLMGLNVPIVLMVGYRGWTRHGVTTDTAAVYTERFLNAFGINYYLVESDADAPRISVAFEEAQRTKRPVAVLVGDEYHGFN